jgi:uncharacterized protein (UPF0332 family)
LKDLQDEDRLKPHKTSREEIKNLLAVYERDIADSNIESMSIDRRFATAYSAALMMARAALAASGYRASGEGAHYTTIQSLAFTIGLDAETINKFNKFRKKRNVSDYEMAGMVSYQEVNEAISLAYNLHKHVFSWLDANHPELIK